MVVKIKIFFVFISLLIPISSSESNIQKNFNEEIENFIKERSRRSIKHEPISKSSERTQLQSMRKSTKNSKYIHDISTFSFDFAKRNSRQVSLEASMCPFSNIKITCDSNLKYSSFDGSCNNLKNPLYGKSETPYTRSLAPEYDDNISSPRSKSISGNLLPNPRIVSTVISNPRPTQESNATAIVPSFGQFLTHDIAGTATTSEIRDDSNELNCPCDSTNPSCISIKIPSNDNKFRLNCMSMTRSSMTFPYLNCTGNYREQLNLLSHYIDGTAVYGMSKSRSDALRTFVGGQLKTSSGLQANSQSGITSRTYLPLSNDTCNAPYKCFLAGEYRTSENLGLVSMQTLFNREHNRVASLLAKVNPSWNDEILFFETRRIVTAFLQHITYNEWLPIITGDSSLTSLKTKSYFNGYDQNINPSLTSEFATSALRFGHSLIKDKFSRWNVQQNSFTDRPYDLSNVLFKSNEAYNSRAQGLNSIMLGLLNEFAWKFGSYGNELQNRLFEKTLPNNTVSAFDLLAVNINRGRDHGIPPYVKYVQKCLNLTWQITSFDDLRWLIRRDRINALQSVYENVKDIDLYVGGLLEFSVASLNNQVNGLIGPTFACLVKEQFNNLKKGDRFYYENGPSATSFSLDQLNEIKKTTLSSLICNNYDINSITKTAFLNPSQSNPVLNCSLMDQIDFSKWKI